MPSSCEILKIEKIKSVNIFPNDENKITAVTQIHNDIFAIGTKFGTVIIFHVRNMEIIYEHQIILQNEEKSIYPIYSICKINENSIACSFLGLKNNNIVILDLGDGSTTYLDSCGVSDIKNLLLVTYNVLVGSYKNYLYMWNISTKKFIHKIIFEAKPEITSMILLKSVLHIAISSYVFSYLSIDSPIFFDIYEEPEVQTISLPDDQSSTKLIHLDDRGIAVIGKNKNNDNIHVYYNGMHHKTINDFSKPYMLRYRHESNSPFEPSADSEYCTIFDNKKYLVLPINSQIVIIDPSTGTNIKMNDANAESAICLKKNGFVTIDNGNSINLFSLSIN